MKLSNAIKCVVYLLYAYFVILTICASGLFILGLYLLYHHLGYNSIVENYVWLPSVVLLLIGVAEVFVTYFGWRAVGRRNNCLISLFCASLFVMIIAQLTLAAWVLVIRRDIHTQSRSYVYQSFNEFIDSGAISDQNHYWNRMQAELRCCGAHGISDFSEISIPWTCYNRPDPGAPGKQIIYDRGCLSVLVEDTKYRLLLVAIAAAVTSFVQVYGVFCTIHLILLLKEKKKVAKNANLGSHQSPTDRNIEMVPFASSGTGTLPKSKLHDNLQMDLKRATAERMSRRMSQK